MAFPAIAQTASYVPLSAYFYAVTVRIDDNALVIAVTGTSRTVDNGDPVTLEPLRQFIHNALGAYRNRQMSQTKPLSAGRDWDQ
jgi:hypothetical protein